MTYLDQRPDTDAVRFASRKRVEKGSGVLLLSIPRTRVRLNVGSLTKSANSKRGDRANLTKSA